MFCVAIQDLKYEKIQTFVPFKWSFYQSNAWREIVLYERRSVAHLLKIEWSASGDSSRKWCLFRKLYSRKAIFQWKFYQLNAWRDTVLYERRSVAHLLKIEWGASVVLSRKWCLFRKLYLGKMSFKTDSQKVFQKTPSIYRILFEAKIRQKKYERSKIRYERSLCRRI